MDQSGAEKGGNLSNFLNIYSVAKYQTIEGETLWSEKNSKTKSHNTEKKTERVELLVSPGIVCFIRTLKTLHPNLETLHPNFETLNPNKNQG